MDALTLLHSRNSAAKLTVPAPSGEALDNMLKAALRAPDHAWLRPWRFLTIEGEGLTQLGELFVNAAQIRLANAGEPPLDPDACNKLAAKAQRAPLIVVVIATVKEHPKVPAVEQVLSAGCAAHSILLAAHAQGYAGIWRTGINAEDETVRLGLGLSDNEQIVGYVYLGTVNGNPKPVRELAVEDFCQAWTGS